MKHTLFADWLYNDSTKQIETIEGVPVGPLTFEYPWSTNLGLGFRWYRLNPMNYPTRETAARILSWVQRNFPLQKWRLNDVIVAAPGVVTLDKDTWPLKQFPQIMLELVNEWGEVKEQFSPGLLAFGLMKNGETAQRLSFEAEIRVALSKENF